MLPLLKAVTVAGFLAVSVFGFSLAAPDALGVWVRRNVLLDDAPWPRKTRLTTAGFQDGMIKVARGTDYQLQVFADTTGIVPAIVEVRYQSERGGRGRAKMIREGDVLSTGADEQKYIYTFQSMLASTQLTVAGGDARIRDLTIEVVDSPQLTSIDMGCDYPDYLDRRNETLSVAGAITVPRGTALTLDADANKPLVQVKLARSTPNGEPTEQSIDLADSAPSRLHVDLGIVDSDQSIELTLSDSDGITSRKATELVIRVEDDAPPRVKVRPHGVGTAITSMALIPLRGTIEDDHRLTAARIGYRIDSEEWRNQPLGAAQLDDVLTEVDEQFDVATLHLDPGKQLTLQVEAEDNRAIGDGPQSAASEPVRFEIVTRDDLMAMLESRELNLRRRLQALIDDVGRVRDSLAALETDVAAPSASPQTKTTADANETFDAASLAGIRLHRAQQDSRKNAEETLGIANSIEAIREELIHNRVDSEETKERLTAGVANPLNHIARESFATLDVQYQQLQTDLEKHGEIGAPRPALAQIDTIQREMRAVLARMLEMETFNELVDTLRELIETQDDVQTATQQLRRRSVLDLLGD
ncbi:MAG: hypothetical protein R3C10_11990 [Pirellulales bacterium]